MGAQATMPVDSVPQALDKPESQLQLSQSSQLKILTLASLGYSNAAISRETGHNRITVAKVLRYAGVSTMVQQARNRFAGMLDKSASAIEHAIKQRKDVKTSANTALAVARGTGALQDNAQVQVNINVNQAPEGLQDEYKTITVTSTDE